MKNSIKIMLLSFLLVFGSCADNDNLLDLERLCQNTCDNEEILEIFNNVEAKVIKFYDKGYILTVNQEDFEDEFFIYASDDDILVPCNWESPFQNNTRVIISGRKKSCCGKLSFPNEFRTFGCKFEITAINTITDRK